MPAKRVAKRTESSRNEAESNALLQDAQMEENITSTQRSLLLAARNWLGTPYRYGGSGASGIDCSAFVQSVFAEIGVMLPRTSREQAEVGSIVARTATQPGDLVFFNTSGTGVSHVGIMVDETQFVHASTSKGVTVSSLNQEYYDARYLFSRRVL